MSTNLSLGSEKERHIRLREVQRKPTENECVRVSDHINLKGVMFFKVKSQSAQSQLTKNLKRNFFLQLNPLMLSFIQNQSSC